MNHDDKTQTITALAPDRQIGHYRIIRKIGEGGMGEVYLASDTKLQREVALKFIPSHLSENEDFRSRFTREARAAARLNHPNIVTIYEVNDFNGRPYFVMEHVSGKSLQDFADDNPLPLDEVVGLVGQICEGLSEAHTAGIVHRDIKASNIVVDEKGRPRLLDFGLATMRGNEKITRTGSTIGTVAYMSPEQISGKETDARSDIFSLGVVFYELIAGKTPFRRDSDGATISAIANDEPEPLARFKQGVSQELEQIVGKLLRKDPAARYQHVDDILADLRNLGAAAVSTSGSNGRKMIAVLPFENLGATEDEYFADGVTEEITSRLAVVSGLGVISRTSALRYKDTGKSISEIGRELRVDYILEGTVRWAKGSSGVSRVRITPQLIHVSDDTHLWAERYDREIDDIFEVQTDIAEHVITQLNVTLLEPEQEAIHAQPTDNVQAYDYFLKGRDCYNRPDYARVDFEAAIGYLEQALAIEPDYAMAHVLIGRCHSAMYFHGQDQSEERIDKARESINRALEIDGELPQAHLAQGELYYHYSRDYDRALGEAEIAARTAPHEAGGLRMAILRRKGMFYDALQLALKYLESNPGDPRLTLEIGITYILVQDYAAAEKWLREAVSLAPDSVNALAHLIALQLLRGSTEKAREIYSTAPKTVDVNAIEEIFQVEIYDRVYPAALEFLDKYTEDISADQASYVPKDLYYGQVYYLMGSKQEARPYLERAEKCLEDALADNENDFRIHTSLGSTLALKGDYERAITHAQRAVELLPAHKDVLIGPVVEAKLAEVLTLAGQHNEAIGIIERILGRRAYQTHPFISLNPFFDPLHDYPRFKALRERYAYQYSAD